MKGYKKLGRNSAHRKSMLRNLVTDLFREGRITTTDMRAKEAGRQAEKLITIAKKGDLHARRQCLEYLFDEDVVTKLFDEIAPGYEDRNGGYTRILKLDLGRETTLKQYIWNWYNCRCNGGAHLNGCASFIAAGRSKW